MNEIIKNLSYSIKHSNNLLYQFWSNELLNELKFKTDLCLDDKKFLFELLYYCNSEIGTRIMEKLDKDAEIKDLELDYTVITKKNKNLYRRQLATISNRFFKCSLDEFAPYLNLYDLPLLVEELSTLTIILPIHDPSWKNFMMSIWNSCSNCSNLDSLFMDLWARLVVDSDYCFNERDICLIFSRGFRWFNLKVGGNTTGNLLIDIKVKVGGDFNISKEDSFAKFIAHSIHLDTTMQKLKELLLAIEIFVHPSNGGPWTMVLANFLERLSFYIHERILVKSRQHPIEDIPISLFNLVLKMLHSKNVYVVVKGQISLKYLSLLDPRITPMFVETCTLALESFDSYRINSCIGALGAISHTIVKENIMELLVNVLPGIDFNDIPKTFACIMFLLTISSKIVYSDQGFASPISFSDWVSLYIDRMFSLFLNLPPNMGGGHADADEQGVLRLLAMTTKIIFEQLSPEIEELVMDILFRKVFGHIISPGTKIVAEICGFIAYSNPKRRLQKFAPKIIKQIEFELDNGAGTTTSQKKSDLNPHGFATMSDATFHWYQAILTNVLSFGGSDLLDYENDIIHVIDRMVDQCIGNVAYVWTADLLYHYIFALFHKYPREYKSHTLETFNSNEFQANPQKHWAEDVDTDNLEICWHIPSQKEKDAGFRALKRYTQLCIDKLDRKFCIKWLSILEKLISVSRIILTPRNVTIGTETDDDHLMFYGKRPEFFGTTESFLYSKQDPEYREWADILFQVQQKLLNLNSLFSADDSLEARVLILKNIELMMGSTLITNHANHGAEKILKMALKAGKQKILSRSVLVMKEYGLHLKRVNNAIGYNEIDSDLAQQVVDLIFDYSLSEYANLGKAAQRSLVKILKCQSRFQVYVFEKIIKIIDEQSINPNEEKLLGAMSLISQRFMGSFYIPYLRKLLESLVTINLKPNILAVITKIGHLVVQPTELKVVPPYNTKAQLVVNSVCTEIDSTHLETLQRKKILVEQEYNKIIDLVVGYCKRDSFSWRYLEVLLKILLKIVSVTQNVRIDLVQTLILLLRHEMPNIQGISMKLLSFLLRFLNKQGKNAYNIESLKRTALIGDSPIILEFFALNAKESTVFVDRPNCWFLYQPKSVTFYQLPHPDYLSGPIQHELSNAMNNPEFWRDILAIAEHDNNLAVYTPRCSFYRKLFRIIKTRPLGVLVPILKEKSELYGDSTTQKSICEIIAGIVRGSTSWNISELALLETHIYPIILFGIERATTETIYHWSQCLAYIFTKIDPNRIAPLLIKMLDINTNNFGNSFFADRKRLQVLSLIINRFNHRVESYISQLLDSIVPLASSPFQEVRKAVAQFLATTIGVFSEFRNNDWRDFNVNSVIQEKPNQKLREFVGSITDLEVKDVTTTNICKTGNYYLISVFILFICAGKSFAKIDRTLLASSFAVEYVSI